MIYRPDVDGLRAVAVIPVLFYHAGLAGFSGGFVGVDIFFVISGYLITRIIHDEMLTGRFSILSFYERRARRILPALLVVLAACFVMGWTWLAPTDYDALSRSAGATLIFLSNVWFWQSSGGYFAAATDYLPLLHTWSLAVEEQFYIVFPLILLVLVRFGRRATLTLVLLAVAASLVLAAWATPRMPSASFYLLPTRFWEMGVGSLLALGLAPSTASRPLREGVAAAGLVAILWAVTMYDATTVFPGLAALLPVLGTAAVIWAGDVGGSFVGRALSARPVVFVGLLSYSLYLWHWPIMAFARNILMDINLPPAWQVITVSLSLALAWLSWRFVERPFRSGSGFAMSRRAIFSASGASILAMGAVAIFVAMTSGAATQRFDAGRLALYQMLDAPAQRDWVCDRGNVQHCVFGDQNHHADAIWALWGDSHAGTLLPAVGTIAAEWDRSLYMVGKGGCPPLPGLVRSDMPPSENAGCEALNQEALETLRTDPNVEVVFLSSRWPLYVEGIRMASEGHRALTVSRDGAATLPGGNPAEVSAALQAVVQDLRAAGRQVVLLGTVPEMPWDVMVRLQNAALFDAALPEDLPNLSTLESRLAQSNAILSELAEQMDGVIYVPLATMLCNPDCSLSDAGHPRYSDNNHLTVQSALSVVVPALRAALSEAFLQGFNPTLAEPN